jgi:tetratricopeptide (TPR) repeat protein
MKSLLNAANVIASIAGTAAAETVTGGAGTAISGATSLYELIRRLAGKAPAITKQIAHDLQAELDRHHLTDDQKLLIPQMVELSPLLPTEVMAAARNPASICATMLAKLTDPAHCTPATQDAFTRVLVPVLARVLDNPAIGDVLRPAHEAATAETLRFIAEQVETLAGQMHETSYRLGVQDTLVRELARRYAPGSEGDFYSARLGLEKALETAATMQRTVRLPHDTTDQVDAVLAELEALNAKGELDAGAATLATARAAARDSIAEQTSGLMRLLDSSVDQARLRNAPQDAADALVEKLLLDRHTSPFIALITLQEEWFVKGRDVGIAYDATVAIHLAELLLARAEYPAQRGAALNILAEAQNTLGRREPGTKRLQAAIAANTAALLEITRDRSPREWALTQMSLGNALQSLGEREPYADHLNAAIAAYTSALQEITRDRSPQEWALTQMNLGNALRWMGEREQSTAWIEAAIEAYQAALSEFNRHLVPLDWARAQMNLGNAMHILGRSKVGTSLLDAAVAAYSAALLEFTPDRAPVSWAGTQMNLANVAIVYFDKTADQAHLAFARDRLLAARQVFADAKAEHYVQMADNKLAAIAAHDTP